jgi:signal transduction histidine kinase
VFWYSRQGALDHRLQLRGAVEFVRNAKQFVLKDDAGSILVATDTSSSVRVGDLVQCAGFIRDPIANAHVEHAVVRITGHKDPTPPVSLSLATLLETKEPCEYAQTRGTVAAVRSGEKQGPSELVLSENGRFVTVLFDQALPPKLQGSQAEVRGIWSRLPETAARVFLAGSLTNFKVLRAGPAFVPPAGGRFEPGNWTLALAAALAITALCAILYRKRTRRLEIERSELSKKLDHIKFELQHAAESRERLGRDLHDHIIQSIYAVGLNVEDCATLLAREPLKVEGRLKSAMVDINSVIRELRNVIMGLESNAIQPQEFRTALKSLSLTMGHDHSNPIRLDLDAAALESLSPGQATELIYIAREAMSNSIRHGGASTTAISLRIIEGVIRFAIEDDGKGFKTDEVPSGGLGLRNMSKRAEDLGATFSLHSELGHGTRIVLDIPTQKQHFSNRESHSRFNR